jgi:carbamate kinase
VNVNTSGDGRLAVVAFGGNALITDHDHCAIPDQFHTVEAIAPHVVDMIEDGWRVLVTHGNGPQVGFILRRSELAMSEVAPVPMDYAVADTQGAIGYMFNKALANELRRRRLARPVATIVTQIIVNTADPAFQNPTKPVGGFMDERTARQAAAELGWTVAQDAGRGWRRFVASPKPQTIVELDTIRSLLDVGVLVVACGGGGIPVTINTDGDLAGVAAVIDKDLASELLARQLRADALIIPTEVEKVAIGFGTPQQKWLDQLSLVEATSYAEAGEFGEGSMRPKVEALVGFVTANPDGVGIITSATSLGRALRRETGTWIESAPTTSTL